MRLPARDFEAVLREALERVPEAFRGYLEQVPVVVEAEPGDELLDALQVPLDEDLFGLYSGPSLPERGADESGLPARITVFRGPHLRACADLEELRTELARTVIHELAHHFGIGEERLAELGWD